MSIGSSRLAWDDRPSTLVPVPLEVGIGRPPSEQAHRQVPQDVTEQVPGTVLIELPRRFPGQCRFQRESAGRESRHEALARAPGVAKSPKDLKEADVFTRP
jgi:hypothetical protein